MSRLPSHIVPFRYELFLKPDLRGFVFSGEETIELKILRSDKKIILHAKDIVVEKVELYLDKKVLRPIKISVDPSRETLTLYFKNSVPKSLAKLFLSWKGVLNDEMRGFYRSRYIHMGKEQYLATTQFEATDARRAFPCFDEPAMKAIFDVTIQVPEGHIAISNTIPTEVVEHELGYKVVRFAPTPKMSTYLVAFIVGQFEHLETKTPEGVVVRIFVTPGKKKQAVFALEVASRCLSFYEKYFGIRYPLPVLDLIAIPDFSSGAMENWGAVTYRESALLVDEEHSSLQNKQWVALVIAHELAHQWFGNLVTMEWWTDLWLNEGFASYIEYLAVDHLFPKWNIWKQFVRLDLGSALSLDSLKETHPIEVTVNHPKEISEIFDAVSYSKGASVIRMLAEYLGEVKFRAGLKHYLTRHAYKNAVTSDLWKAFEEVSGRPIKKLMNDWTKKSGYPFIKVARLKDKTNVLLVLQERFFRSSISRKDNKERTSWLIPISITSADKKSSTSILLDRRSAIISDQVSGSWFKLNNDEMTPIRVLYDKNDLEILFERGFWKLSPEDRSGIIRDVFSFGEAGEFSADFVLKLASYCSDKEDEFIVWSELLSGMAGLRRIAFGEDYDTAYEKWGENILRTIFERVGFDKKRGEVYEMTLLRSLVIGSMGLYGGVKIVKRARELFKNHLRGKTIPVDIRGAVFGVIASRGGRKEFDAFVRLYKKEMFSEERTRLASALASFRDEKLILRALQFSLSDFVRFQDAPIFLTGVFQNRFGTRLAWNFLMKNWKVYLSRYGDGGHLLQRVVFGVGNLIGENYAKAVENFFAENESPGAKRAVRQAVEIIRSRSAWKERDRLALKNFLND